MTNEVLPNDNFFPDAGSVTRDVYYNRAMLIWRNNTNSVDNWAGFSNPAYQERFKELAAYATGRQGYERYMKMLTSTSPENDVFTPLAKAPSEVIDWAYRPISVVVSKLMSAVMEPRVIPYDNAFKDEKRMFEAQVRAIIALGESLTTREAMLTELGIDPEMLPSTEAEMDQFLAENPKLKFTADIIDEINTQLQANNFERLRYLIAMALIIWGISGLITYVDQNDNYHIRYVQPNEMILGYDVTEDFSGLDEAGFLRYVTIFELATESGFSPEQIKRIAKQHEIVLPQNFFEYVQNYGQFNTFPSWPTSQFNNINKRIPVLDCFMLLTHNNRYKVKPAKVGNGIRLLYEKPTKEGENIVHQYYQKWHRATWVINGSAEDVYNFGPLNNAIVKPYDPTRPARPFHVVMPNKVLGGNKSLVSTMIPYIDQCELAFIQLNQILANYVQPGYAFPLSRVQAIDLAGTTLDAKQLITSLRTTGSIVYDDIITVDNQSAAQIAPLARPDYMNEIQRWWNQLVMAQEQINVICGLNSIVQGLDPNPEVGKAQSEIAIAGSDQAIGHLYRAQNIIYESLCQDILINWQYKQLKSKDSYYRTIANRQLIVKIYNGPSHLDWQRLDQASQLALQNGQLTIENFVKLQTIENLAEARAYLASVTRRNMKEMQAAKQANIEAQAQGNIQAGVAAEQEKGRNAAANNQFELAKINLEYDRKAELLKLQAELEQSNIAAKALVSNEAQTELAVAQSGLKQQEMLTQQYLNQPQGQQPMQQPEMEQEMEVKDNGPDIEELMAASES